MNLKSSSKVGYIIAVLSLVVLVIRRSIIANGTAGILAQILAVLLMIWARFTFGRRSFYVSANPTEGKLMTSGPYHYLRHPIYAAVLYFIWAGILSHISLINVLIGLAVTAGLIIRIFAEEHLVAEKYPEYAEYKIGTKRIIPFLW